MPEGEEWTEEVGLELRHQSQSVNVTPTTVR